jgi:hypothetical protein
MRFHLLNCEACVEAFEGFIEQAARRGGAACPAPPLPESLAQIRPPRSLWERLAEWVAPPPALAVAYAESAPGGDSTLTAQQVPSGEPVDLAIDWGPDLMPDGHFQMGVVAPPTCAGQEVAIYLRVPAEAPDEPEEEWGPLTACFNLEDGACVAFVDEPAPGPQPDKLTRQRVPLAWLRAEVKL